MERTGSRIWKLPDLPRLFMPCVQLIDGGLGGCETTKHAYSGIMNQYHLVSFRVLAAASIVQVIFAVTTLAQIKHDYGTYPVPPPPPLPAAGGTVIDPTFKTTIMRLTDQNDGPNCINAYSYWPTFNVNNT